MKNKELLGHLVVIFTIIIWATTFISTKILLDYFAPIEILFYRILLGLIALFIVNPKFIKLKKPSHELLFAFAGLCGVCLYFLFENIALTYTFASNASIIVSTAPFFTAIVNHIFLKNDEKFSFNFFIGFIIAMTGIIIVSFNGTKMQLNPLGDFLSLCAGLVWAFYCVATRKIASYGYNTIQSTRKIFSYGIVFILIATLKLGFNFDLTLFKNPVCLSNILFLGLGASALCFVTWNLAVKLIGAVKTSAYIYVQPVITVIASSIILHENITPLAVTGIVLILTGLVVSELKLKK